MQLCLWPVPTVISTSGLPLKAKRALHGGQQQNISHSTICGMNVYPLLVKQSTFSSPKIKINPSMKLQSWLKTKVAKSFASWVLPCSCGRVRCLRALSIILLANRKKKPALCWWQDCHHISLKTHWSSFPQDFMEQLKQEGAKGVTDTQNKGSKECSGQTYVAGQTDLSWRLCWLQRAESAVGSAPHRNPSTEAEKAAGCLQHPLRDSPMKWLPFPLNCITLLSCNTNRWTGTPIPCVSQQWFPQARA